MKTVQEIKRWLALEVSRLERRKEEKFLSLQESASLDGSIMTCKRLLEAMK